MTLEQKSMLYSLWFNLRVIKFCEIPSKIEKEKIRKTIKFCFEQLDKLKVPFSIQNKIITETEKGKRFSEISL